MSAATSDQPSRLVLTRALPDAAMNRLRARHDAWVNPHDRTLTPDELRQAVCGHEPDAVLAMAMDRLDAPALMAFPPSVKVLATLSVGHEHIDLEAARRRGLVVLHTPDILSDAVAEMAILLLLAAARRAHEGAQLLYEGRWGGWSPTQLLGRDVTGGRLGIFGMGRIGRTIARRASRGFDMKVHYHNRSRLPVEQEEGATYVGDRDAFLSASDFLVIAAPSSEATRGFLGAATIAKLPPGAIVVNIARGDLVDDEALVAALRSGRIASAGLDVFNNEPRIFEAYKTLPNVFLQPHQGSSTMGTRVRMAELLLEGIDAALAGRPVQNRLA